MKNNSGSSLVALLIFVMMGVAITTAAILTIAANSLAATNFQEAIIAKQMADSGIETAYLQILRNGTAYIGEDLPPLNGGQVSINVSWSGGIATIDSTATNGDYIKVTRSVINYNGALVKTSWKEI